MENVNGYREGGEREREIKALFTNSKSSFYRLNNVLLVHIHLMLLEKKALYQAFLIADVFAKSLGIGLFRMPLS